MNITFQKHHQKKKIGERELRKVEEEASMCPWALCICVYMCAMSIKKNDRH